MPDRDARLAFEAGIRQAAAGPMKTVTTERRSVTRFACLLHVQYRTTRGWHPAVALDITETGCRLRVGEDLERGSSVTLRFERPIRDGVKEPFCEVAATVRWSQLQGLSHQAGVQFAAAPGELGEVLRTVKGWQSTAGTSDKRSE